MKNGSCRSVIVFVTIFIVMERHYCLVDNDRVKAVVRHHEKSIVVVVAVGVIQQCRSNVVSNQVQILIDMVQKHSPLGGGIAAKVLESSLHAVLLVWFGLVWVVVWLC